MTGWCILTPAPSRTLQLADSLDDAGFEVWAPRETVKGEPPKLKEFEAPRRHRKVPEFVTRPLLPGFVFARADRLQDLLALAHSPALLYQVWDKELRRMVVRGHPQFRVFPADRPVTDDELNRLRAIEHRRRKPRGAVPVWKIGDQVRLIEGSFTGLTGEVVGLKGRKGKLVQVLFLGLAHSVEISAWILHPVLDDGASVHIRSSQPERGNSGRAAA